MAGEQNERLFHPLDESQNILKRSRTNSSFNYGNDTLPIVSADGQSRNDLWKRHDMTPLRKFFLLSSILFCVLTILIFLYVIPCDSASTCSLSLLAPTPVSWDKSFEGIGKSAYPHNLNTLMST